MDQCCYMKDFGPCYIILLLCVDDMLVADFNMDEINILKAYLSEEFEMKDLGVANQILAMNINRNKSDGSLILSQYKYIGKVLEKFNMHYTKIVSTTLGVQFNLTKE